MSATLIEQLRRPVTRTNTEVALLSEAAYEAADELMRLQAEIAQLRGFAVEVMGVWPESGGSIDGDDLQDAAVRHGLLRLKDPAPTRPCGESCTCVNYYDVDATGEFVEMDVECYERTALLVGTPKEG